ncbi:MAG: HEAT repeat domain-containing protein [Sphingobacteriaceae bacterium]|nr:HEAT repeat domain-containing protein [Sphingobacteriaceae bacterium]
MNTLKSLSEYALYNHGASMLFIFWLIFSFLILACTFLIVTIFSRLSKISDSRKSKKLKAVFELIILQMLEEPETALLKAEFEKSFKKKYLKNRFQKQLLVDELVAVHKGLEGELANSIQQLFRKLKLDQYCLQKLGSSSWEVKAAGINELREMQITEAMPLIAKMVLDKEFLVRGNAQLALLELQNSRESISFLKDLSYQLSDWEQLRLHESLKSRGNTKHDSFKTLYNSDNASVIIFGIRMSSYFGCHQDIAALTLLSTHHNEEIRFQSIKALRKLGDFEAESMLAQRFSSETIKVRIAILDYLRGTGYNSLQLFLDALTSSDHQLSLMAAFGLRGGYDPAFLSSLLAGLNLSEEVLLRLKHAEDPRLPAP